MIKIILVLVSMLHLAVCFGMESSVVENQVYLSTEAVVAAKANLNLGKMRLRGEGCQQDYEQARENFEKASKQSDDLEIQAKAYFHLGKIYYFGQGVEKNDQKMRYYLETVYKNSEQKDTSESKQLLEIAEFLRDHESFRRDGFGDLHFAAACGEKEEIEVLLTRGADVKGEDLAVPPPLHIAAAFGHRDTVELLLENGADANASDNDFGTTPLYWAARYGHRDVLELLLEYGAAIQAKDKRGFTPLYHASVNGHKEVVELLLEKRAYFTTKDKNVKAAFDISQDEDIVIQFRNEFW